MADGRWTHYSDGRGGQRSQIYDAPGLRATEFKLDLGTYEASLKNLKEWGVMIKNEKSRSLLNHYPVFALEFLLFLKHIELFPTSRPPCTFS